MITVNKSKAALIHHMRSSKGQALVEFAIVLLVLIPFLFGIIDFGRMMMVEQVLNNAARAGAREGSLSNENGTNVRTGPNTQNNYIIPQLTAAGITGQTIVWEVNNTTTTKSTDLSTAIPNYPVKVTISVPFSNVSWVKMYAQTATLKGECTMRKEE